MKNFSSKPQVEKLDISLDGAPVYVRSLNAGDKLALSEKQGEFISLAGAAKAKDAEEAGLSAAQSMSPRQYKAFVEYCYEYVYLRWCDKNGKRKYSTRDAFDDLPSEVIDAIYREASTLGAEENVEEAEGNS